MAHPVSLCKISCIFTTSCWSIKCSFLSLRIHQIPLLALLPPSACIRPWTSMICVWHAQVRLCVCMSSCTSALTKPIVLLLHLAVCFHSPTCCFSPQIKSLHRPSAKTKNSCCNTTYSSACLSRFAMMCTSNNVSQGVAQQEPCSMELHSAQRPNKPPRISTTQSLS